jgi:mannose-1-phosphate guanylyltransferase/mannose-6-phosphate isomerase
VTNQEHFYNVLNQVREVYPDFPEEHIIVEPEGRNTFPAIMLALRYLAERSGMTEDDRVVFTPADAYVAEEDIYLAALTTALDHSARGLVIVGVTPSTPDTGYGYIEKGILENGILRVKSFCEKPDANTAQEYLASGNYFWNSGLYVGTLGTFLQETATHTPEVHALYERGLDALVQEFSSMPHLSIDHALTEHSKNVFVVPGTFGWSDVGSFDALAEVLSKRGVGYEKHVGIDSEGVFVHSESKRLVVTIGIKDLVIVDHHDSLLIHEKGRSGEVGTVLKTLKVAGHKEVEHNLFVHRPWGRYEVLIDTPSYKVKKIVVYPGAKLSLQSHMHRAEHWVIVHGTAEALVGDKTLILNANESAYIPAGNRHRLTNPGKVNLEIIEVQTGTYLGEDDIQRHEDTYKRI